MPVPTRSKRTGRGEQETGFTFRYEARVGSLAFFPEGVAATARCRSGERGTDDGAGSPQLSLCCLMRPSERAAARPPSCGRGGQHRVRRPMTGTPRGALASCSAEGCRRYPGHRIVPCVRPRKPPALRAPCPARPPPPLLSPPRGGAGQGGGKAGWPSARVRACDRERTRAPRSNRAVMPAPSTERLPGQAAPNCLRCAVPNTAAGLHGKPSLVNGCNAAKGSRQIGRVPWEDAMAPAAGPPWRSAPRRCRPRFSPVPSPCAGACSRAPRPGAARARGAAAGGVAPAAGGPRPSPPRGAAAALGGVLSSPLGTESAQGNPTV